MARLAGKVAIVTGGGSGMGLATAKLFANEGAKVVVTDLDEGPIAALAKEVGPAICHLRHDVSDEAGWARVIDLAKSAFGGLHILVNNAGNATEGTPESTSLKDWRRVHSVNVEGVFLGCRAAIPAIHASGGGSIVNIASRRDRHTAAARELRAGGGAGAAREDDRGARADGAHGPADRHRLCRALPRLRRGRLCHRRGFERGWRRRGRLIEPREDRP
jgi:NAD(P)-dependent dehydrogenase (short-subunit alcohol dehydrogenase family)